MGEETYKPLVYIISQNLDNINEFLAEDLKVVTTQIKNQITKSKTNESLIKSIDYSLSLSNKMRSMLGPAASLFWANNLLDYVYRKIKEELEKQQNNPNVDADQDKLQEINNILIELENNLNTVGLKINNLSESIQIIALIDAKQYLKFPPGHPLPGQLYKAHPLENKKDHYLPYELFDSLLYQEREAELVNLLVDLGAIEITIEELLTTQTKGEAQAKASLVESGGGEAVIKGENKRTNAESRNIRLKQRRWNIDDFDEKNYSWLPNEPSWATLVYARVKGGCLSFEIELNSDTFYSIFAGIGTKGVIQQFADIGAEIDLSRTRQEKKLFKVNFIDD